MALRDVIEIVDRRLAEGADGAAGWFPITRVHLDAASIQDCLKYLADIGAADDFVELTAEHYRALAALVGNRSANPRIGLNRHQLLAFYQPLQLLERENPARVSPTRLTAQGFAVAMASKAETALEHQLSRIVFCRAPFYAPDREAQYQAFHVRFYPASLSVMDRVGGWIDRDEFDLFVSRIRTDAEIAWAVDGIRQFRALAPEERPRVLERVPRRGPLTAKVYQNWRDMGLHIFSFLALGTRAVRIGDRLVRSDVAARPEPPPARRAGRREPVERRRDEIPALRIPEPPAAGNVGLAPPPPVVNDGRGAEVFVGKLMAATGWRVVYYGHRRGYGFDIWAGKGDSVLYVEVKSCTGDASTVTFTSTEMQAAIEYGDNFLLVVVENAGTARQHCWSILNPAARLRFRARTIEGHVVPATQWRPVAVRMDE